MPAYATQNQLDADWVGEFTVDGKTVYVQTRFEIKEGITSATFDMPLQRLRRIALKQPKIDSSRVHFELPNEMKALFQRLITI